MNIGKRKGKFISKWSGKCDFADDCEMIHNPQEIIEKSEIYLGDARVMIKEEKDLIPYYTHLIAMGSYNREKNIIHLSKSSFIDSEEREHLAWKIKDVITTFRKAKKEKVEVTLDYLKSQKYYFGHCEDFIWLALIDKVKKNPNLIKVHLGKDYRDSLYFISEWLIPNYFCDIHDSMHNRFRKEFVNFAHENGYRIFNNANDNWEDEGTYNPIISHMCLAIREYNEMCKKYGGNV